MITNLVWSHSSMFYEIKMMKIIVTIKIDKIHYLGHINDNKWSKMSCKYDVINL